MGQCEKILDDGSRCSNQAVPGTRFCTAHGRINFRKVREDEAANSAPPPKPVVTEVAPPVTPQEDQLVWQAISSPAGQKPAFPELRPDDRNILVAPEGIIWLSQDGVSHAGQTSLFDRLVKLLGFLSQAIPLYPAQGKPQVHLAHQSETGDYLVLLRPHQPDATDLSTFYDAVATAARLVNGRLYVGKRKLYVQYRDDHAPRGYDVPGFRPPTQMSGILLIARWGSRQLNTDDFAEITVANLVMRVAPLPGGVTPLPELLYALVARPLYAVLARYFQAHALQYRLARLHSQTEELILFELQPNPETRGEAVIPAFILDYLSRLPQVTLLCPMPEMPAVLLQWRHRYPLHLPHLRGALAQDGLIILCRTPHTNLQVQPIPTFLDGDRLTDVYAPQNQTTPLVSVGAADIPALRLPVQLRPDYGAVPATAALLLTAQETAWLRPLLYRLPGQLLAEYQLCQGETVSILLGHQGRIDGIPFGLPFRRLGDSELFFPLRSRFIPSLPWPILRQALQIQDGVYTFLTETKRYDIAHSAFQPLAQAIVAPSLERGFRVRPVELLPVLAWRPRSYPDIPQFKEEGLVGIGEEALSDQKQGWKERITPRRKERAGVQSGQSIIKTEVEESSLEIPDMLTYLRSQAQQYEQQGELLTAAFCYDLFGDTANSARCYRLSSGKVATT